MSERPDLFSYVPARRTDPDTSRDAAKSINVTGLEQLVLEALADRPMTSYELAEHLHLSLVTVSPRLRPLCDKGLVEDSGERRRNPSSWRNCAVWRLRGAA